jgi:hypothetical protein
MGQRNHAIGAARLLVALPLLLAQRAVGVSSNPASTGSSLRGRLSRKGRGWSALATGVGCGVADGSVLTGGVTIAGALSGPCGSELVAVQLGEVVRCHQ